MTGQTISHYRVLSKLGEGGMGIVYKAEDTKLRRVVALKFLPPHAGEHGERFLREAQAAASLNHNNICTIHEIDEEHGFIAMEFIDGPSVKEKIDARPLPLEEALDIVIQASTGLQAAHEKGIVHRDIKPANLMLTAQGQVKIMDFGLAQAGDRTRITKGRVSLGTPAYMSPEQTQGQPTDRRTDIWSIGVALCEMLTGRLPFAGDNEQAIGYGIVHHNPEPVTALRSGLPVELDRIMAKALAKPPEQRYQNIADLAVDLRRVAAESQKAFLEQKAKPVAPVERPKRRLLSVVVLCLTLLTVGGFWWRFGSIRPSTVSTDTIVRLTSDVGLTAFPALSPEGKLVAFASDRSGRGDLDIWIQPVNGRDATRLTDHEADDYDPSFSPDNSQIAFRSDRDGGGIYVMPALGGRARLIVKEGRRPRFSPDGTHLAYSVENHNLMPAIPDSANTYIVAVAGGAPRQVQPRFTSARSPIWAPDGRHLLFVGVSEDLPQRYDWWVSPVPDGTAVRTGIVDTLLRSGLASPEHTLPFLPAYWTQGGIVFSARAGDSINLWQAPISPQTWQVAGSPRRLTFGAGPELQAAASATGIVAFTNAGPNLDIWSLPIDANSGRVAGSPKRLTSNAATDHWPSVSLDGKKVLFSSTRSGKVAFWLKHLDNGTEIELATDKPQHPSGLIEKDGKSLVYFSESQGTFQRMDIATGKTEKLCNKCFYFGPTPDGTKFLYGSSNGIKLRDLTSGTDVDVLKHPKFSLNQAQVSSDGKWLIFYARLDVERTRLFIIPFQPGTIPAETEWIPVTEGARDLAPAWSPDGNTVYFGSNRDGFDCIWAQRLNPGSKRPTGPALEVAHFHAASRRLGNVGVAYRGLSVAHDKLVFTVEERTGNLWLIRGPQLFLEGAAGPP